MPDAAEEELQRMMTQILRPISLGFGVLLLFFALQEIGQYTGTQRILIVGSDALTGLFLLSLGIWMTVRPFPARFGHAAGAAIAMAITFTDSVTRAVEARAADFPLVTMVLVGAGMSFLSLRWLAGVVAAIWIMYLGVIVVFIDAWPSLNPMLVATVLGLTIYWGRKNTIDRLVRTKHRLEDAQKELEKKNEDLDLFASTVAHDLQNPVAAIRLKAETLKLKDLGDSAPMVDDMARLADNMGHMIQDVLSYAKAGSAPGEKNNVDLNRLVETIRVVFKERLDAVGGTLEVHDLPPLQADETQIEQLLLNLVGNAIHYHADEPLRIEIHGSTMPDGTLLTITDNGLGFDAEDAANLFERFSRGDTNRRGHGIGLATCRRILDNHGGTIRAASEAGQGAVFTLWFPNPKP